MTGGATSLEEHRATAEPGRLRVLVVDDNPDIAFTCSQLLKYQGYDARAVLDGLAAIEVARSFRPHIALLDIGLPGLDGFELARRLRQEHGPGLRLIAISAYDQREHRQQARTVGFDEHLVKPVPFDELLSHLHAGHSPSPSTPRESDKMQTCLH